MAAGVIGLRHVEVPAVALPAAVLLAVALLAGGCATPTDPAATPAAAMASLSPAVASTAALVEDRLAGAGFGLQQSAVEHRPGEPAAVQAAPRAVLRVALPDPGEGWLLIYDLGTDDAAGRAGRDFAAYLAGGAGQTNYPRDAQFALSQVGQTLVFHWWSRERAGDAAQAERAFDLLRGVGRPIEVIR